jgi:hypothetical protein
MELYAMKPDLERFEAKMTVVIEKVTHHMDDEEQEWSPRPARAWVAHSSKRPARAWSS